MQTGILLPSLTAQVIDPDPHFRRVVGYFRPADYATWAIGAAGMPALYTLFERLDPTNGRAYVKPPGGVLRVTGLLGFIGGFLIAYNRSSQRFYGNSENSREVTKDRYEVKRNLSQGLPAFGKKPSMSPELQEMAMRNSKNSQFALFFFPWFSFFTHEYHGVDLKRYYEVRQGEENWEFVLPAYESLEKTSI